MSGGHLSSETIDLLMLASLPSTEVDLAKRHLSACDRCRMRWQELEDDKRRFEQFVLPRTLEKVQERARGTPVWERLRSRWSVMLPALGLATAAAIALVVLPGRAPQDSYIGIKGGSTMKVVASRGAAQFQVGPGGQVQPGDRIRFVVSPSRARFVMVASVDPRGQVSVYYPFDGARSAPIADAPNQELPGSVELDDSVGQERLYALFSSDPLDAADVRRALQAGAAPESIPGVSEAVGVTFDKTAP